MNDRWEEEYDTFVTKKRRDKMADINTMLNAAYDAYDLASGKVKELTKKVAELEAKIVAMEEQAKPNKKAAKK